LRCASQHIHEQWKTIGVKPRAPASGSGKPVECVPDRTAVKEITGRGVAFLVRKKAGETWKEACVLFLDTRKLKKDSTGPPLANIKSNRYGILSTRSPAFVSSRYVANCHRKKGPKPDIETCETVSKNKAVIVRVTNNRNERKLP
jgi:hypothetical protein